MGRIPRLVEDLLDSQVGPCSMEVAGVSIQRLDWKNEETRPAKLKFAVNAEVKFRGIMRGGKNWIYLAQNMVP